MTNAERQARWRERQRKMKTRYVTGAGIDRETIHAILAEVDRRRAVPGPDLPSWATPEGILRYVTGELERLVGRSEGKQAVTALQAAMQPGAAPGKATLDALRQVAAAGKAESRKLRDLQKRINRGERLTPEETQYLMGG